VTLFAGHLGEFTEASGLRSDREARGPRAAVARRRRQPMSDRPPGADGERRLGELGYSQELRREFGFWSSSAVGFAAISPIVATYGMFGLALTEAGPTMFWAFFPVLIGMTLVVLVLGEISSRFPVTGGIYQWTRQQVGAGPAWFAGWAYIWVCVVSMAAVAYAGATFLARALGFGDGSRATLAAIAVGCLALGGVVNTAHRLVLKVFMACAVVAGFTASALVGGVLLIGHRAHPISVLFDSFGTHAGRSDWDWFTFAWLGAVAFVGYSFIAFEPSGTLAEEVERPERNSAWSMLFVLVTVGAIVVVTGLAFLLSMPDIGAAMTGNIADPVATTLKYHFGSGIMRPMLAVITIGFVSCMVAFQTTVSRAVFSYARDRMVPGSSLLRSLSEKRRLPVAAVTITTTVAALVLLLGLWFTQLYTTLISFVIGGYYIAFAFPVISALVLHFRGQHTPGPFSLGRYSFMVTLLAGVWLVFETINVYWPRYPDLPWYQNWAVALMAGALGIVGAIVYRLWVFKGRDRTASPAGHADSAPGV